MEVLRNGQVCGKAEFAERGLYTSIDIVYKTQETQPLRAYLKGESGLLKLGVPVPEGGAYRLRRTFVTRDVLAAGAADRILLLSEGEDPSSWRSLTDCGREFDFLKGGIKNQKDCLFLTAGDSKRIAVPYGKELAFPLEKYFCFACIERIKDKNYAVFTFDGSDRPKIY